MSKITEKIQRYASVICKDLSLAEKELGYANLSLQTALNLDMLQSDIVFQMQHTAHSMGKYVADYLVINIGTIENPIYSVLEQSLASEEQIKTLEDYYARDHVRHKRCTEYFTEFALVTSVRAALFNRTQLNKTKRLCFAKFTLDIGDGVTVIKHNQVTMLNLVSPNKLLHIDNQISMPNEVIEHDNIVAPE